MLISRLKEEKKWQMKQAEKAKEIGISGVISEVVVTAYSTVA
jgi:hypothetical protein